MGQYDLFRKIAQSNLTAKEREVNQIKYDLLADFEDSPSYVLATRNGTEQGFHIVDENAINKSPDKKRVLCKPNESIAVGDLIVWDSNNWLCVDIDGDDTVQIKGIIQKSTHSLTYNKNGISYEVPYSVFDSVSLTRMGIKNNEFLSIPDSKMMIMTPDNEVARLIQRDDVFTLYDKDGVKDNYKIIDINRVRISGLIIYELQWTVEEPTIEEHEYNILILEGEEVTLYGGESSTLQLNAQCKLDGTLVSNPEVAYSSSNIDCCTVDEDGLVTIEGTGSSTITATYGDSSDTIIIKSLLNVVDNYEIMITPLDTTIDVNETKTFTASVRNNGVNMPYHGVTWTVDSIYCTYVVNERDVTITAKNNINKLIKIKATLDINNAVFKEQTIKIKSLV